jgi:hypothetical protein
MERIVGGRPTRSGRAAGHLLAWAVLAAWQPNRRRSPVERLTRLDLAAVMPACGHDLGAADRDTGDMFHRHGFGVVSQHIRWCTTNPAQRRIQTRDQ